MIGYHLYNENGFYNTLRKNHIESGCKHFQIFAKNPRQTRIASIKDDDASKCKKYVEDNDIFLITHASYLLNMSNPDKWDIKINSGINEINLAIKLGAKGTVFHVGKHLKLSITEGENLMYNYFNTLIQYIIDNNLNFKIILETSAACGTELLSNIQNLGNFYNRFNTQQLQHFKICIDTCHVFSAGYTIHTKEGCLNFINEVAVYIGWPNVMVIHLNDSLSLKGCGCKLDRHANINQGFIRDGMRDLLLFTIDISIPHILETPIEENRIVEIHRNEINIINQWMDENYEENTTNNTLPNLNQLNINDENEDDEDEENI